MSKHRHKMSHSKPHKAAGGGVEDKDAEPMVTMGNKNVLKEAKEKTIGDVSGAKSRMRLDRPGRKTGGAAWSNPLSSDSATHPMSKAGTQDKKKC